MTLRLHMISFNRVGTDGYNVLHAGEEPTAEQQAAIDRYFENLRITENKELDLLG